MPRPPLEARAEQVGHVLDVEHEARAPTADGRHFFFYCWLSRKLSIELELSHYDNDIMHERNNRTVASLLHK